MSKPRKPLFDAFDATSTEAWEAAIVKSLKGKDYDSTLIWKTLEGIDVRPYYRSESTSESNETPGTFPYTRGIKERDNDWEIREDFDSTDAKAGNKAVLAALMRGINAFGIPANAQNLAQWLNEIKLQYVSCHLLAGKDAPETFSAFVAYAKAHYEETAGVRGSLDFDPLGHLASTGEWLTSESEDLEQAVKLVEQRISLSPLFRCIQVSGANYHNAGASIGQELGAALAHGNEYLARLTAAGVPIDEASASIQFELATGPHYFLEIAKLRAFRMLWAQVVKAYQPEHSCSTATHVHSVSSLWTYTLADPYVNMLRATTQAMAAALGGCNSLTVLPFDAASAQSDEFSQRIARNVQLILKDEAHLEKVIDPAAGSYYLEHLTDQLAQKAWSFFQSIESKGGYVKALETSFLQDAIEASAAIKQEQIESGKWTILGVNKYPNANDKPLTASKEAKASPTTNPVVRPINVHRASEILETQTTPA